MQISLSHLNLPKLALSRTNSPTLATAKWIPISMGAIHLTKLQTGPTGKRGPPERWITLQYLIQCLIPKPHPMPHPKTSSQYLIQCLIQYLIPIPHPMPHPKTSSHSQGNFTINTQREDIKNRNFKNYTL